MKRILISTAIGAAFALPQSVAWAAAMDDLKDHGCLACHDVDKKKVGPSYKEVSAKFKGKPVEELMASMKSKPVHKGVLAKTPDAPLKTMLEWVLAQ